jgi:hypothetical protein
MRTSIITNCLGALIVASAVVMYFSPVPGSFWGNTFFGIPYSMALVGVPLAAAGCAAAACWLSRRSPRFASRGALSRGISIALIAFLIFSIVHGVASSVISLLTGAGMQAALMALVTVPLATVFFGGLFILPICCVVAVVCEWMAGQIAA